MKAAPLLRHQASAQPASVKPVLPPMRSFGPLESGAGFSRSFPAATALETTPQQLLPGVGVPAPTRETRLRRIIDTGVIQRMPRTRNQAKGGRGTTRNTKDKALKEKQKQAFKNKNAQPVSPTIAEAVTNQRQTEISQPSDGKGHHSGESSTQPVRVLIKADPPSFSLPNEEQIKRIIRAYPLPKPKPGDEPPMERVSIRKHKHVNLMKIAEEQGVPLGGANQAGLGTKNEAQTGTVPPVMDYIHARPMQMLSQLSEIMMNAAPPDKNPVEVQFGYGIRKVDGKKQLALMASTNTKVSQEWLSQAVQSPADHILSALESNNPNLKSVALKLLTHSQQQAQRRGRIKALSPGEKKHLKAELGLADLVRTMFLNGQTQVVGSDAPNNQERHAEQNIVYPLVRDNYTWIEVAGTKIRCEGCSSELHTNIEDESGTPLIGKAYLAQASEESHEGMMVDVANEDTKMVLERPNRPRSSSPPAIAVENRAKRSLDHTDVGLKSSPRKMVEPNPKSPGSGKKKKVTNKKKTAGG